MNGIADSNVAGVLMAGGRSRRMGGGDKCLRALAGRPILAHVDFSPDAEQSFVYNADGGNHRLWMVQREGLETIDTLGRRGRNAGQFESPHSVAVDSNGNMYVGETLDGRRMQKFVPIGQSEAP